MSFSTIRDLVRRSVITAIMVCGTQRAIIATRVPAHRLRAPHKTSFVRSKGTMCLDPSGKKDAVSTTTKQDLDCKGLVVGAAAGPCDPAKTARRLPEGHEPEVRRRGPQGYLVHPREAPKGTGRRQTLPPLPRKVPRVLLKEPEGAGRQPSATPRNEEDPGPPSRPSWGHEMVSRSIPHGAKGGMY